VRVHVGRCRRLLRVLLLRLLRVVEVVTAAMVLLLVLRPMTMMVEARAVGMGVIRGGRVGVTGVVLLLHR
jgi:hypothetical protein